MTKPEAADNLQAALDAFQKNRIKGDTAKQQTPQFYDLNDAIRRALQAVGEDPMQVETLEARGLFNTTQDQPIPDTYIPGVEQLIADLKA